MRKFLKMTGSFFHGSYIASLVLVLTLGAALFMASAVLAGYRRESYVRDIWRDAGLRDSLYLMVFNGMEDAPREEVRQLPGVACVLTAQRGVLAFEPNRSMPVRLYDKDTLRRFSLDVEEGRSFVAEDTAVLEGVISGDDFDDTQVGDLLLLPLSDGSQLEVRVVGRLASRALSPTMMISSTEASAQSILGDSPGLHIYAGPAATQRLSAEYIERRPNCIAVFKKDATQAQKDACRAFLEEQGVVVTCDEVLNRTNALLDKTLKESLPIPVFLLFVSTISLFSVSILLIYKKLQEQAVYALCGCSRGRGFAYILTGTGLISLAAVLLNLVFIGLYPRLRQSGLMDMGNLLFDGWSIVCVFLYLLVALLVSVGIPYVVFRRYSPLEFYRRREQ